MMAFTSPAKETTLILILGALMAFTSLSTDIYLPAMPQMSQDLRGNAELTVTGFLIGFAIAQLFWGPVSDRIGRKLPLYAGMVLFALGSAGCALSDGIGEIMFWRVFQAVGACTAPMLARAMIRDLYGQTRAAQMLSTLTLIVAVAPIVGPLLGGQLIRFSTWHAIFWLLAAVGVLMFAALVKLPETHPLEKRGNESLWQAFAAYGSLLKNKAYMRYVMCVTLFYVSAYAFIIGSPFVYIDYFGVDPQHYGWLFALNIVGLMGVSAANRRLVGRYRLDTLIRAATAVAAVAGIMLAACAYSGFGGIYGIILPVFVFFATNGIIAACTTAAALNGVPQIAGSASALLGSLQYGSGIVSSLLLAALSDGTPHAMALIIALFGIGSMAMAFLPSAAAGKRK